MRSAMRAEPPLERFSFATWVSLLFALFLRHFEAHNVPFRKSLLDFRVEEVRQLRPLRCAFRKIPRPSRCKQTVPFWLLSGFFSVKTAASGTAATLSAVATGIFTFAVMPGTDSRVDILQQDPRAIAFDVVLDRGLRGDALD